MEFGSNRQELLVGLGLAAAALLAACGDPGPDAAVRAAATVAPETDGPRSAPDAASRAAYVDRLRALGVDRHMGIQPVSSHVRGRWEAHHYDRAAGAACIDGSDYIVSIRPATRPSDDVLLYLQGGGACWNAANCFGVPLAKQTANVPTTNPGYLADDPANPLRDYHVVFASYCDGSVFSGDHIADYDGRKGYHWGLRNLSAAVTLLKRRYPNPGKLLVAGSSAGGFGTLMAMGVVRAAYPEEYLYVLNDSGPGLENPALKEEMGDAIRRNWRFRRYMPDDCTACDNQLTYLIRYVLDRDPGLRVGMFSFRDDAVIGSLFLQLYGNYHPLLRSTTDAIHTAHPGRFKRFFVDGLDHTVMGTRFYDAGWPHGQSFAAWLDAMLNHRADWVDRR